jgi:transcriptional regulator with XRE-family HTH domain
VRAIEQPSPPDIAAGAQPADAAPIIGPTLVGALLRERRRHLNFTLDGVARRVGITKGFLSQIERDKASPSVATLMRLRAVLSLSMASLFQSSLAHTVRSNERQALPYGGDRMQCYLVSARDAHRTAVIWAELEPGAQSGADPHSLRSDEEVIFVVSGSLEISIDDEVILLRVGDTFTFDPRRLHQYRNPSSRLRTIAICVLAPPPQ